MAAHTQPARGMRDFLPEDVRRRQYVIDVVRGVYERYGYEPLETPTLENIETLTGKYGDEGNQLIFKVLRRGEHGGETDLALRYDLTVPLARVVAEHRGKLPKFFKRYQIQPVWRADRPARGRFREFYQCDVDVIGSRSTIVEVELCAAVCDVLTSLGFDDFTVQLNHRALLTAVLTLAGAGPAQHSDVLVALDKLDKIGPQAVVLDMVKRGIDERVASAVLERTEEIQHTLSGDLFTTDPEAAAAARDVADILALCEVTAASGRVKFTPRLARGLSYYTGAIMEIAVEGIGSLGGGGRYDGLIGMFSGEQIPACGFSLGLERILVVMGERGMFPASVQAGGPDVLVTVFDRESIEDSLRLAGELRAGGLRAELYPEADKLGKQLKYASARDAAFVAIVGADERARGEVTIKNMKTGDQQSVARLEIAATLRRRISDPGSGVPDATST
jgi:histidyl-tRNA synthetase